MKTTIKTARGAIINLDITTLTATIPAINLVGKYTHATTMTDTEQLQDGAGTHKMTISGKIITLLANDANIVNNSITQYLDLQQSQLEAKVLGLSILQQAYYEHDRYNMDLMRKINNCTNTILTMPESDIDILEAQYPLATLYCKAKAYTNASNYRKSLAGKEAIKILLATGDMGQASQILNNWHN